MLTRRQIVAAVIGLVAAAGFARLGVWQLDRLKHRRLENTIKFVRMSAPPSQTMGLLAGVRKWRRITLTGTFDFEHQIVLVGEALNGAPGVYLITPFNADPGRRPAVLVNRGWVYSPDAMTVDLAKYDETPHTTVNGYVEEFSVNGKGPARTASSPHGWRRLDEKELPEAFPYPIAPFYIVAQPDSGVTPAPGAPVRLPLPSLDEGPHFGYAIQWFLFALIALGGSGLMIWRDRRTAATGNP
jgi:surfeit locus 1 family protein